MASIGACFGFVLCGLAAPVRAVLISLIDTVQVFLTAQVATLSAALLVLDIPLTVARAAVGVAQEAVDLAMSMTNFLPPTIQDCLDVTEVIEWAQEPLKSAQRDLAAVVTTLNRKLAFRAEVAAQLAKVTAQLDRLDELSAYLATVVCT